MSHFWFQSFSSPCHTSDPKISQWYKMVKKPKRKTHEKFSQEKIFLWKNLPMKNFPKRNFSRFIDTKMESVVKKIQHVFDYLKMAVWTIAPKHWMVFATKRWSTFSSRWRLGSILPTFLMANCSGVIFSSSSKDYDGIKRQINQPLVRPVNQSINHTIDQSINQSITRSTSQSINQSIEPWFKRSKNQSINRVNPQSILKTYKSTNQSTKNKCYRSRLISYLDVILGEFDHALGGLFVGRRVLLVLFQRKALHPRFFVQIEQHLWENIQFSKKFTK